jgi:hypothetical protein
MGQIAHSNKFNRTPNFTSNLTHHCRNLATMAMQGNTASFCLKIHIESVAFITIA